MLIDILVCNRVCSKVDFSHTNFESLSGRTWALLISSDMIAMHKVLNFKSMMCASQISLCIAGYPFYSRRIPSIQSWNTNFRIRIWREEVVKRLLRLSLCEPFFSARYFVVQCPLWGRRWKIQLEYFPFWRRWYWFENNVDVPLII